MYNLHPIIQLAIATEFLIDPKAKSSQIRGDARHLKGNALQWGIAPRLIIRREDAKVVTKQHIVVAKVNDAIITRKITRNKYQFNLVILAIVHAQITHHAQHLVAVGIVKRMCKLGHW